MWVKEYICGLVIYYCAVYKSLLLAAIALFYMRGKKEKTGALPISSTLELSLIAADPDPVFY